MIPDWNVYSDYSLIEILQKGAGDICIRMTVMKMNPRKVVGNNSSSKQLLKIWMKPKRQRGVHKLGRGRPFDILGTKRACRIVDLNLIYDQLSSVASVVTNNYLYLCMQV